MRILSTRAKNSPGVVSVPRFNKKNSERERARVNTKTTSGLRREKTAHEFSQATLTTSRFFLVFPRLLNFSNPQCPPSRRVCASPCSPRPAAPRPRAARCTVSWKKRWPGVCVRAGLHAAVFGVSPPAFARPALYTLAACVAGQGQGPARAARDSRNRRPVAALRLGGGAGPLPSRPPPQCALPQRAL